MKTCRNILTIITIFFMLFSFHSLTAHGSAEETMSAGMPAYFERIQVPFIVNKHQIPNKEVIYFAKPFNNYIHVEKDGMITYNFSSADKNTIVINELFTEKHTSLMPLEPPPESALKIFRQRGQITGDISNYYRLSYGTIYDRIELQLLAFTDGLEKLFTIAPGGDPSIITVTIKSAEGLKVNESGKLEILTKYGSITFAQPRAYQFMGEERQPVEVSYIIRKSTAYGFKLGGYDKTKPLIIGPFLPPNLLTIQ